MANYVIEVRNLKKYYGKHRGIEDVSFKIEEGTIFGFIGPNGAGKSTTIRTIMGLLNIDGGEILINSKPLDKDDIETKKMIGYLPSEINLYGDMTVKELFDYHASFYDGDLTERRKELVSILKIDEEKKVEELSLGNLKKVGIVLAMMHSPKILILDEPTSGLDPILQHAFHDLLIKEKQKGTTILYSSHILSEISSISDIVCFIKEGVIIKEEKMETIKNEYFTYLKIESKDIDLITKELGLNVIREENGMTIFMNKYKPNELLEKLAKYDITRLLIEEVTLEDLFINYYM